MWFEFTGNTKKIGDQVLKEFAYTEPTDECNVGDIAGYAYSEECLKTKFSAKNVNIFKGASIESNCKITDSSIYADTRINTYFQIHDSELSYTDLLPECEMDKEYELSFVPKKIVGTKIAGSKDMHIVMIVDAVSTVIIKDSEIYSGQKPEGDSGKIFVKRNGVLDVSGKSKIFISKKNIFVHNRSKLVIKNESVIDNAEIKLIKSAKSRSLDDPSVNIVNTRVKIAKLNCSSKIDLDGCYIYGTLIADDNSQGIIMEDSSVYRKSIVQTCDDAKILKVYQSIFQNDAFLCCESYSEETTIIRSTFRDNASVRFSFGKNEILNSEVAWQSRLRDASLDSAVVKGNSKVCSTTLKNSSIFSVTIGYCCGEMIDQELFSHTTFENLTARGAFDFFVFPVIANSCYYIYANKQIYRLRRVDATKTEFQKVDSGLGLEFDFWIEMTAGLDNKSFFSSLTENDIAIIRSILKKSDEYISDIFDKRKEDFFTLKKYSEFATYFMLFKLFAIKALKPLASEAEIEIAKKVDDFLTENIVFDISKKKTVFKKEDVVFFPRFLLLSLDDNDFRKSFTKTLPKLRENDKFFFI